MNNVTLNSAPLNSIGQFSDFSELSVSVAVAQTAISDLVVQTSVAQTAVSDLVASVSVGLKEYVYQNAEVSVSDYKWMSSSFITAQQQQNLRPYFTLKIKDDSIVHSSVVTDVGYPQNGQVARAPDGILYAVGKDASGNLGLWIIPDGSVAAKWEGAPDTIILTAVNWNNNFNASIAISDWIAGSYVIDVGYFTGTTTGDCRINLKRSTNKGISFGSALLSPVIGADSMSDNFYCAVGQPLLLDSGVISAIVFNIRNIGSAYAIYYSYYDGSATTNIEMSSKTVNSYDWILHSLSVAYWEGKYKIVFSGYHQYLESSNNKYSIYFTELCKINKLSTLDVWSDVREVITSLSSSVQNENSFLYPKLSICDGRLYLTFKGLTISTISEAGIVTTFSNFYYCYSDDFLFFTYPTLLVSSAGVEFTDTYSYSFVCQDAYFYLSGSGKVWKYTQNDIEADISDDVLSYTLDEVAGAPSSIKISLGNQNGQWVGPSPTRTNYAAIAKNKKIFLEQGYYVSGVPITAPRNIFYIDEIQQYSSSSRNDVLITGRDLYKGLRVMTNKFTYNFEGPDFVYDNFDGSTISDWNQKLGSWEETSDVNNTYITPASTPDLNSEYMLLRSGLNIRKREAILAVTVNVPDTDKANASLCIYPYYVDTNNWIRFRARSDGGVNHEVLIETCVNGIIVSRDSDGAYTPMQNKNETDYFTFYIRMYDYTKFHFMVSQSASAGGVKSPALYNSAKLFAVSTNGQFDLYTILNTSVATFGVSAIGYNAKIVNVKYCQFDTSNSTEMISKEIASKTGIFAHKFQKEFEDYLFDESVWSGTRSFENRMIKMEESEYAIRNSSQIAAGEIEFDAKIEPADTDADYAFSFLLRNERLTDIVDCYKLKFLKTLDYLGNDISVVQEYIENTGVSVDSQLLMCSSALSTNATPAKFNNVRLDFTEWHHYKITFNNNWIYVYIDDVMYFSWFDDNDTYSHTTGYVGFLCDDNGVLYVKNVVSNSFYNQIRQVSVNPGDDFETSLKYALEPEKAWMFSDLLARMKVIKLKTSDASSYTYENQTWSQEKIESDLQYVNQITVISQNVSVVLRDSQSISDNQVVRDRIIVDYKIRTLKEAQERAAYELIDANRFVLQADPKQVNNVGAELFDVITIINADTGLNEAVRVYSQQIIVNGATNEYSIRLGTGKV